MDRVDNVMGPSWRETFLNHMVEEIGQITNQRAETVLEELCLVAFLICCFAAVHRPDGLPDVLVGEMWQEEGGEVT